MNDRLATLLLDFNFGLVFSAVLVVVGALWLHRLKRKGVAPASLASLSVAMGVLGTFIGILLTMFGLKIGGQTGASLVNQTFGGMMTAFITSVAGLLNSIRIRSSEAVAAAEAERAITDDPYLIALTRGADQQDAAQHKLGELNRQIEGFTSTVFDAVTAAAQRAAEANSVQFKAALAEHLGSEFRELRAAISLLNTWQSDHRRSLESYAHSARSASDSLTKAAADLAAAEAAAQQRITALNQATASLTGSVDAARALGAEQRRLETLVSAMVTAVGSLEASEAAWGNAVDIANSAQGALDTLSASLEAASTRQAQASADFEHTLRQTAESIGPAMRDAVDAVRSDAIEVSRLSVANAREVQEVWQQAAAGLAQTASDVVAAYTQRFEAQVATVADAMTLSVKDANARLAGLLDDVATEMTVSAEASRAAAEAAEGAQLAAVELNKQLVGLTATGKSALDGIKKAASAAMKEVGDVIRGANREFDLSARGRVEKLNSDLTATLGEALGVFAGYLTEVSKRFADDYVPLADKLATVVESLDALEKATAAARRQWEQNVNRTAPMPAITPPPPPTRPPPGTSGT